MFNLSETLGLYQHRTAKQDTDQVPGIRDAYFENIPLNSISIEPGSGSGCTGWAKKSTPT